MAIRAIWSFNHLPSVASLNGFGRNQYGITNTRVNQVYTSAPTVNADGSLLVYLKTELSSGSTVTVSSTLNVNCSNITDGVSPRSFMGMHLVHINALSYPCTLSVNNNVIIDRSDPILPPWNVPLFLEVCIDRVNKIVTVYADGEIVKTITGANAICDGYSGGGVWRYGFPSTPVASNAGAGDRFTINHCYFTDEVAGETESAKLGPVRLLPIIPATTDGANWVSSDSAKTLNDVLNTAITTTALLTAPVITSPTPTTNLDVTFSSAVVDTKPVLALQYLFDSRRVVAESVPFTNITYNGIVKAIKEPQLSGTTLLYGLPTGIAEKAPDNTPWTMGKVKQTKLTYGATG